MARRLLGADSANVFSIQEPEETAANQVPELCPELPGEIIAILPTLPTLLMDSVLEISCGAK